MNHDYEKIFDILSHPVHCGAAQAALLKREPYRVERAQLLGVGGLGYVWALGEKEVLKIYHAGRYGGDVCPFIQEEWDTHRALNDVPDSPAPKLLESRMCDVKGDRGAVGWAVFSKLPGRHLTWEDDHTKTERALWGRRFSVAAITFEKALKAVADKPACWKRGTVDTVYLHLKQVGKEMASEDRDLLEQLRGYIEHEGLGREKMYLHGDIHEGNALFDPKTQMLRLFDPSIKYDYPESNIRYHVPRDMQYVQGFMETYTKQSGTDLSMKLVWAFGVVDNMRDRLLKNDQSSAQKMSFCIEKLTELDPQWRQKSGQKPSVPMHPHPHLVGLDKKTLG